ncbi:hypothetical protein [Deinococcus murrayi]|uniref:hypothetical protein n=1 Tax=Deinococcus murrayi TaxID=68910 RepID=UPI000552A6F9|nr:hypothetical protein [Deinococcus murrayi]
MVTAELGATAAAPLIGTTKSFPGTGYCKTYGCSHITTVPLSTNLKHFTYSLKPEFPGYPANQAFVVRDGTRAVSAGLRIGGQDWVFGPDFHGTRQLADLIALTTGKRPTNAWVSNLKCQNIQDGGAALNKHQGTNRTYTVACVVSPGMGFVNFDVSIY